MRWIELIVDWSLLSVKNGWYGSHVVAWVSSGAIAHFRRAILFVVWVECASCRINVFVCTECVVQVDSFTF